MGGESPSVPFVALLRAVNLGGASTIATAGIREQLVRLRLRHVSSVGQSGNFAFAALATGGASLERRLGDELSKGRSSAMEVLVRSRSEWRSIVAGNPFVAAARDDPSHLLVALLKATPSPAAWAALERAPRGRERIGRGERHAYLVYPDGIGRSPLTTAVIERHLGIRSTGRNWNTVSKLAALLEAIPASPESARRVLRGGSSRTTK